MLVENRLDIEGAVVKEDIIEAYNFMIDTKDLSRAFYTERNPDKYR